MSTVQITIETKLKHALQPSVLDVLNESHRHNVPPGSESHFKVTVVSDAFSGKPLVARHRVINSILQDELEHSVHALALHTMTPAEWQAKNGTVAPSPPCLGGDKQR